MLLHHPWSSQEDLKVLDVLLDLPNRLRYFLILQNFVLTSGASFKLRQKSTLIASSFSVNLPVWSLPEKPFYFG